MKDSTDLLTTRALSSNMAVSEDPGSPAKQTRALLSALQCSHKTAHMSKGFLKSHTKPKEQEVQVTTLNAFFDVHGTVHRDIFL